MRPILENYPATSLANLIAQARSPLEAEIARTPPKSTPLIFFFSFTDGTRRATVVHFSGDDINTIWRKFADWRKRSGYSRKVRWLRIDWVISQRLMTWKDCQEEMGRTKRNYFRYGIALDRSFRHAFLEQEMNANAMLYLGSKSPKAGFNPKNFSRYGVARFGSAFSAPKAPEHEVALFTTKGILVQPNANYVELHGYIGGKEGRDTGRRPVRKLDTHRVRWLIEQASQYLVDQLDESGRFTYGIHPCFDREIEAYNTLRHASTTYSMLEAWEVTSGTALKHAIERSIAYLTGSLIREFKLTSGEPVAYLLEGESEIKLGGNAVCLLTLVKYTELTQDERFLSLMEKLAAGIAAMQDSKTGKFAHVLHAHDLSVKEQFRVIYYDGEAAFGLMRLYGLTGNRRWLDIVEKAFDYFIEMDHWKIHDHWLSYCVNELTTHRPKEEYFEFGIKNFSGHLNFVIGRITTYPTLLELMMAAHKMIRRIKHSPDKKHLLEQIDLEKFYHALEKRAHYLLNGFFWPEFAIYFKNPQRILGSFFIRHHSFRVRIDDVEHYLSGYCAYLQHYLEEPHRSEE